MKNFFIAAFLAFAFIFFIPDFARGFDLDEDIIKDALAIKKVVATAYYMPLKNQKRYLHGSFREEVEMNGNGLTFTEEMATIGTIAADLKIFPIDTVLFIPDYGIGIVKDIGSRIRGKRIDLYMGKGDKGLKKAVDWGKRKLEVFVLKWGD